MSASIWESVLESYVYVSPEADTVVFHLEQQERYAFQIWESHQEVAGRVHVHVCVSV